VGNCLLAAHGNDLTHLNGGTGMAISLNDFVCNVLVLCMLPTDCKSQTLHKMTRITALNCLTTPCCNYVTTKHFEHFT